MVKVTAEIPYINFKVDRRQNTPLYLQLYQAIRKDILSGTLTAGQRLPSTRVLAKDLKVSRNIIALAFEQLIAEGYLKGKTGAGTYVTDEIKVPAAVDRSHGKTIHKGQGNEKVLSYGLPEQVVQRNTRSEQVVPFQTAIPDMKEFPFHTWARIASTVFKNVSALQLGYEDCAGYLPLRDAIANYLRTSRGVRCETEQVIIVNGSQQGLSLTANLLLEKGSKACIEDPGYTGTRSAMMAAGATVCPVPVGVEGVDVDYAIRHYSDSRLIYVTPSHQYPLGGTMPLASRLKLLEWANANGIYILEDDYDSEFRYSGNPLSSLQGLDTGNSVIYLGTFSKVLFPALRIGYLVVPPQLVQPFRMLKAVTDRHSPVIEQAILADFINQGHFGRHLKKMKALYKERQECFIKEMEGSKSIINFPPADTGMHLVGWLPDRTDEKEFVRLLSGNGIIAHAISDYTIQHKTRPGLLFGYTAFNEKQIAKGARVVKKVLNAI